MPSGMRNPYRFSFDRATGDVLIGDVGQSAREEIDWIGSARGTRRELRLGLPRGQDRRAPPRRVHRGDTVPGAIEPLFDYGTPGSDAVTGGFVVRDPSLTGLVGRYLYADFYAGDVRSLALNFAAPDDKSTDLSVSSISVVRRGRRRDASTPSTSRATRSCT